MDLSLLLPLTDRNVSSDAIAKLPSELQDKLLFRNDRAAAIQDLVLGVLKQARETPSILTNDEYNANRLRTLIVKCLVERNHMWVLQHMQDFDIKDEQARIEIAKLCLEKDIATTAHIATFAIQDQNALFELAKLSAAANGEYIAKHIKEFGIKDEKNRIELARLSLQHKYGSGVSNIANFEIHDQGALFELAKLSATKDTEQAAKHIKKFDIKDEQKRIELAKLCAPHLAEYIANFEIQDPNALSELAKLSATKNPRLTAEHIKKFGIKDEKKRIELARICLQTDNFGKAVADIDNFEIQDPNALLELAKLSAAVNGKQTAEHINSFYIEEENDRIELAKLCIQNNSQSIDFIHAFKLQNRDALFELAKFSAERNGERTFQRIRWFKLADAKKEIEVAKICIRQTPEMAKYPQKAYVTDSNTRFIIHALCMLSCYQSGFPLDDYNIAHIRESTEATIQEALKRFEKAIGQKERDKMLALCMSQWYYFLTTGQEMSDEDRLTLEKLFKYRNKKITIALAYLFCDNIAANSVRNKYFHNTMEYQRQVMIPALSWVQSKKDLQRLEAIHKLIHEQRDTFKDARSGLLQQWLNLTLELNQTSLSSERKLALLEQACSSRKHFQKKLALIGALCSLSPSSLDRDFNYDSNMAAQLSMILRSLLPIDINIDQFLATWGSTRVPLAWFTYRKGIAQLNDPSLDKEFAAMTQCIMDGTYLQERYNTQKSPHLSALQKADPKLFENWQTQSIVHNLTLSDAKEGNFSFQNFLNEKIKDGHLGKGQKQIESLCQDLCQTQGTLPSMVDKLQELNDHLQKLEKTEFHNDINALIKLATAPKKDSTLEIVDTHEWQDLFLSGTEVLGSCQRIDGDPHYNKCLLAYVMDGKNRMIAIRDKATGAIIARAMFRLLLNEKDGKPALFLDRTYPESSIQQQNALEAFAIARAKKLGLTLFTKGNSWGTGGTLVSLGSRSPYEYEDAAEGVIPGGKFELSGLKILFDPAGPSLERKEEKS